MRKVAALTVLSLTVAVVVALALGLGYGLGPGALSLQAPQPLPTAVEGPPQVSPEVPGESRTIAEAWRILWEDFVNPSALDQDLMTQGAIQGMIESLNDPYTAYIPASHYSSELDIFKGSFEGIGAYVGTEKGQIVVIRPMPGSPADRAGIRAGDVIAEVDGTSTRGLSLQEVILRIRGPRGTMVTVGVVHRGEQRIERLKIIRDEISIDSVLLKLLPEKIAHITITFFSERTNQELVAKLREAQKDGAKGIVLDLRDNPGGLLSATVDVASQFLREGVVVIEEERGTRRPWPVKPGGRAPDIPLVVLVNGNSASGSEVLAAALQDHGRAVLIGTTTSGKGTVNMFRRLSDGSALYVSFARWYTPQGRLIEGTGLIPDIAVELTEEQFLRGEDPQLQRALEYLKTKK